MNIAIAIDNWKFSIFERCLKQSGYQFSQVPGLTDGTTLLTVITDNGQALYEVVKAANIEAAKTGRVPDED